MRITAGLAFPAIALACLAASFSAIAQDKPRTLLEARAGFKTRLVSIKTDDDQLEAPPPKLFSVVRFSTPAGEMSAYLGKPPSPGKKHPAIIWLTGGFPVGGIDSDAWEPVDIENDQSAKAYRLAGVVMMYPTLRGSFGNPGFQEMMFGEVDDVLGALEYLRGVEYVDPKRIYLGGHSTGGNLALLVAEATAGFRAVISFGPIADMADLDPDELTYDPENPRENFLRSPVNFLDSITSPTIVIEGAQGNKESLRKLQAASANQKLRFVTLRGANHFDVLAPLNRLLASKIAALDGEGELELSPTEAQAAFDEYHAAAREAYDLETLGRLRREMVDLKTPQAVSYHLYSSDKTALEKAATEAARQGMEASTITEESYEDGSTYFLLKLHRTLALSDLQAVFSTSKAAMRIADDSGVNYGFWDLRGR